MSTQPDVAASPDEVHHQTRADSGTGLPTVKVTLTAQQDQRTKTVLTPPPGVIPVIFIPGIMGTNLRAAGAKGKVVWQPPNMDGVGPVIDAIGQLLTYLFKDASKRQQELSPGLVAVDDSGPVDPGESGDSEALCRQRGWGSVMRSAYQPLMAWLQKHLNTTMDHGKVEGWWAEQGQGAPSDWGDTLGNAALDAEDIKHLANYRFEVWACGYNWLQSNNDSGQAVADFIHKKVLPNYHGNAKKVVLVTHSMGGLVARALTQIHQFQDVLGVVHGVQPATGAPASYKRMRAGFEGIEQVILGRNAAQVTAVLANAPGGLELLPTADYNGGKPWLKVRARGAPAETPAAQLPLALPQNGDPYAEIYLSDQWYGLLPKESEGLLDMSGAHSNRATDQGDVSPLKNFRERVRMAEDFHAKIKGGYHAETYAHYGADAERKSWSEVVWLLNGPDPEDVRALQIHDDDLNGTLHFSAGLNASIVPPDAPGDGTVPKPSGEAPGQAGVRGAFVHGRHQPVGHEAARNAGNKGYDHQMSYNDPRARFATIYGIAKAARKADWHE